MISSHRHLLLVPFVIAAIVLHILLSLIEVDTVDPSLVEKHIFCFAKCYIAHVVSLIGHVSIGTHDSLYVVIVCWAHFSI